MMGQDIFMETFRIHKKISNWKNLSSFIIWCLLLIRMDAQCAQPGGVFFFLHRFNIYDHFMAFTAGLSVLCTLLIS